MQSRRSYSLGSRGFSTDLRVIWGSTATAKEERRERERAHRWTSATSRYVAVSERENRRKRAARRERERLRRGGREGERSGAAARRDAQSTGVVRATWTLRAATLPAKNRVQTRLSLILSHWNPPQKFPTRRRFRAQSDSSDPFLLSLRSRLCEIALKTRLSTTDIYIYIYILSLRFELRCFATASK